jgi:hypothetical protein
VPQKEANGNYYEQYCQLSIANVVMQHQIKRLLAERQDMHQKLRTQKKEEEAKGNSGKPGDDESVSSSMAASMPMSAQAQAAYNKNR